MNVISGATAIGYGFNALGQYGPSSLTQQVFAQTFNDNKTYTDPNTNITYSVPDNVSVQSYSPMSGSTQVFSSQYDLQTYFSEQAGLSGSYGGFSGQISVAYSNALQEWGSVFYALTNAWVASWECQVISETTAELTSNFQSVFSGLPSAFNATTQDQFFEFFYTYGTHFVSGVGVGGYFCYYEAVNNSGSYSQTTVSANVSLEYNAVFATASGQSQTDWNQLGQSWVNNRIVTVSALGGSPESLEALNPTFGTNAQSAYNSWLSTIAKNPSEVQFYLTGWDVLCAPGSDQQTALQQALSAYMNLNIYVMASGSDGDGSGQIVAGGVIPPFQVWPTNPPSLQAGLQIAVIDSASLSPIFNKVYYISTQTGSALFTQVMSDLASVSPGTNQYCAVCLFNCPWYAPAPAFVSWLANYGITASAWLENYSNCGSGGPGFNYVALGAYPGTNVQESFSLIPDNAQAPAVNELNTNPYVNSANAVAAAKKAAAATA